MTQNDKHLISFAIAFDLIKITQNPQEADDIFELVKERYNDYVSFLDKQ